LGGRGLAVMLLGLRGGGVAGVDEALRVNVIQANPRRVVDGGQVLDGAFTGVAYGYADGGDAGLEGVGAYSLWICRKSARRESQVGWFLPDAAIFW
jgi:hypothetical protein